MLFGITERTLRKPVSWRRGNRSEPAVSSAGIIPRTRTTTKNGWSCTEADDELPAGGGAMEVLLAIADDDLERLA
jgi:hypothetical protein